MPDSDNPTLYIEWFNDPNWIDITSYAQSFIVKDGGILKIPTASIVLKNTDSKFTDEGANHIDIDSALRIRTDVRGTVDTPFYGIIYGKDCKHSNYKTDYLTLENADLVGKLLQRDTKTNLTEDEGYGNLGTRIKDAIEDMLSNPDGGISTGITLVTDSGIITTRSFPRNLDKDYLLDAIRDAIEEIDYDGWTDSPNAQLKLYPLGNQAASPAITLTDSDYISVTPLKHIKKLKNHILVWGGGDLGFPPYDIWCEYGLARYNPDAWSVTSGAISDVTTDAQESNPAIGEAFQKILNNTGAQAWIDAWFDISTSGYTRPQGTGNYIDCVDNGETETGGRFTNLHIWFSAQYRVAASYVSALLEDTNGDKIKFTDLHQLGTTSRDLGTKSDWWYGYAPWIGDDTSIFATNTLGQWGWYGGSSTFNWQIDKVGFRVQLADTKAAFIDGIKFAQTPDTGGMTNSAINPLINPIHNPAVKDVSAPAYPTVYHHIDNDIACFEHAQAEGKRILDNMNITQQKIEVRLKDAKTWLKPNQTLTLTYTPWNISSATYRVTHHTLEWNRRKARAIRSTLELVPSTTPLSAQVQSIISVLPRSTVASIAKISR